MSFDRLNSLEAQPTTMRRDEDPQYRDDPGFDHLAETLSDQLFTLTSNISRLSNQIALLGTKRDTERVRERVHNLLEETRAGFKDVGEGIKTVQTWEDVNVWLNSFPCFLKHLTLTLTVPALPEVDTTEVIV
jgi:syntaxin 7